MPTWSFPMLPLCSLSSHSRNVRRTHVPQLLLPGRQLGSKQPVTIGGGGRGGRTGLHRWSTTLLVQGSRRRNPRVQEEGPTLGFYKWAPTQDSRCRDLPRVLKVGTFLPRVLEVGRYPRVLGTSLGFLEIGRWVSRQVGRQVPSQGSRVSVAVAVCVLS